MTDKKPLSEYLKSKFGLDLDQVVNLFRRGLKVRVNGILTKKMSYALSEGDTLEIGNKSYIVKWTKDAEDKKDSTNGPKNKQ